ncbi:MAG: hypothetical protein K1W33_06510 [Clostridia bacterium]
MNLIEFLNNKPAAKKYVEQNNCNFGEMTPIPNQFLKTLPDNQVIINEDVFRQLVDIADKTNNTGCEHTFFLCCPSSCVNKNKIEITNFLAHNSDVQRRVVIYDSTMVGALERIANKVQEGTLNEGVVVLIGHTHPAEGRCYDNFSFGDLNGYSQGIRNNVVYESRKIETGGCMLTADGKIRMVFYDPEAKDFYKFTNIKVRTKEKELVDFEKIFKRYKENERTQSRNQRFSENSDRNDIAELILENFAILPPEERVELYAKLYNIHEEGKMLLNQFVQLPVDAQKEMYEKFQEHIREQERNI